MDNTVIQKKKRNWLCTGEHGGLERGIDWTDQNAYNVTIITLSNEKSILQL